MLDRNALQALLEIIGGDRADLVDLISGFLDEAPGMFEAFVAAGAAGDAPTVRRIAHTLKSNARDLGASALSSACAQLEADLTAAPAMEGLAARVAEIHALWPATKAALVAEITPG